MSIDNPSRADETSPLSLMEAAAAYANPIEEQEPEEVGQSAHEDEAHGEQEGHETEPDETEDESQLEAEQPEAEEPEAQPTKREKPTYVDKLAKVKMVDGSELTVEELINGNLLRKDYTQKTQSLADDRKALQNQFSEVQKQFEQQMAAERDRLLRWAQAKLPQKPAYDAHDPLAWIEKNAQYEADRAEFEYQNAQYLQFVQKQQAEESVRLQQVRDREWQATLEKLPELSDANKLDSFARELNKHASEYGFAPQEIQQALGLDHRQILVLRDAIKWRNLQAEKSKVPAKVEGRPPVMKSGTRPTADTQKARDVKTAMDRLKTSGTVKDGIAALLALEQG